MMPRSHQELKPSASQRRNAQRLSEYVSSLLPSLPQNSNLTILSYVSSASLATKQFKPTSHVTRTKS